MAPTEPDPTLPGVGHSNAGFILLLFINHWNISLPFSGNEREQCLLNR